MKKILVFTLLLISTPGYAAGLGAALAGFGGAQNPDWQEQQREARQEQIQRDALDEQRRQTIIMRQQLLVQQQRQQQTQFGGQR